MFENQVFDKLVSDGQPTGEVISVNDLLTEIRGLEGAAINSVVLFENGERGLVRAIDDQVVQVLNFAVKPATLGTLAVLESPTYQIGVGPGLVGRVVDVLGRPLDGKGAVSFSAQGSVFSPAPGVIERQELKDQLVSGVSIVDTLFPVVLGQRIAVLGDSKSGKSTFLRQLAINQATSSDRIIVYVLIAKRQVDVDAIISALEQSGAIKQTIVVVASSFDSLTHGYLAPYVGCTMAEHFWKHNRDVVVIYDDLYSHAKIYREISLLAVASPGRDSYPGDMFYAHSSLLERAGKLAKTGRTLTALPVVVTPGDDITAYLPTNIMSITDGQIIFDLTSFRSGIRPAVNIGLSVSRVGGHSQSIPWKQLSSLLFRKMADYRQAAEFAQFGSELSPQAKADLALGKQVYEIFKQTPAELHDINTQYLMLAAVLRGGGQFSLNISQLKRQAKDLSTGLTPETDPTPIVQQLLEAAKIQVAK